MSVPAFSHSAAHAGPAPQAAVSVPPALSLPVIEKQFIRRRHDYWPRLQEKTRAWLLEKRLMPEEKVYRYADGLRYTDLVAGYYLGAPDELLAAIADFSTWFFAWDDRHDRDAVHGRADAWRRLGPRLHQALDSPASHLDHPDPLVAAFADVVPRLTHGCGPRWTARFSAHFHEVIRAYDVEFENRLTHTIPPVDSYVELRRLTFAHWIWIDLLEPASRCELPAAVRKNPAYRRAALATQDFSAWYNDLCSLPKELAGDEVHNLGISLIHHEGLSLESAVAEVHGRVSNCVTEFMAAEKDVLRLTARWAGGSEQGAELAAATRDCLSNMRNWFSSVYWFHHESGRYRVESWDDRATPPYVSDQAGEK
ncbi:multidrug MFS transporter [Streptomyces sp. NPDC050560]|uniref:terpene synthase family protein n=1 Tax=Streptomyces sp. NPDC050560 TaxID=3365630 RepID=UPI0037A03A86